MWFEILDLLNTKHIYKFLRTRVKRFLRVLTFTEQRFSVSKKGISYTCIIVQKHCARMHSIYIL